LNSDQIIFLIIQAIILGLFIPIILHFVKSKINISINENLVKIKTEYAVSKLTYEHLLPLLLDFYSNLQRYYRICQNAQHCDVIKQRDGTENTTKNLFIDNLDDIVDEWNKNEAKMRLLLPDELLDLSDSLMKAFNKFRNGMKEKLDKSQLYDLFVIIDDRKQEFEHALKQHLRIEELYKT
jgi:hypothetical protein